MPLGGRGVVGRIVRDGETVSGGVGLDFVLNPCRRQRLLELFGLLGGERVVIFGAADVDRRPNLVGPQVGAVLGVGDQPAAVEGRGGSDPLRQPARHYQRCAPAHAIAGGAEPVAADFGATGEVVEERVRIHGHLHGRHAADH